MREYLLEIEEIEETIDNEPEMSTIEYMKTSRFYKIALPVAVTLAILISHPLVVIGKTAVECVAFYRSTLTHEYVEYSSTTASLIYEELTALTIEDSDDAEETSTDGTTVYSDAYAYIAEMFEDVCPVYDNEYKMKYDYKETCTFVHVHIEYAVLEELGLIPQAVYVDTKTGYTLFAYSNNTETRATLAAIWEITNDVCCEGCYRYNMSSLPYDTGAHLCEILKEVPSVCATDFGALAE